jgi:FkbM family methyltransferase
VGALSTDQLRESRERFLAASREFVPYVVAERDGLLFVVPTDDPTLGKLFVRSEKDKERAVLLRALERLAEAGVEVRRETFVDVGANVGTAAFAALGAGFERVVAIEPVPSTFRLLRANLVLNGVEESVRALQLALSDRAGTTAIDVSQGARKARLTETGGEEVAVARLDDVVEDEVDFLLVDAEGHEVQVLAGAERVLGSGVPLVLELNPKLLALAGRRDELPRLLARHYTHVLDLRARGAGFASVERVADLIEEYEGRSTDLLACRRAP